MFGFDSNVDYNGSATMVILASGGASFIIAYWARAELKRLGLRCRDALSTGTPRILFGASIICFGFAWGSLVWWPVFPMLIAGNTALQARYIAIAGFPAALSNWFTVLGLSIMMWPAMVRWLTFWTKRPISWIGYIGIGCIIIMASLAAYLLGAYATIWVAAKLA